MRIDPGYQSAILLIRNPRKAFLAEWARRKTPGHTGVPNKEVYKGKGNNHFRRAGVIRKGLLGIDVLSTGTKRQEI